MSINSFFIEKSSPNGTPFHSHVSIEVQLCGLSWAMSINTLANNWQMHINLNCFMQLHSNNIYIDHIAYVWLFSVFTLYNINCFYLEHCAIGQRSSFRAFEKQIQPVELIIIRHFLQTMQLVNHQNSLYLCIYSQIVCAPTVNS